MTPRKDLWQLQGTDVYLQSPRSKGFIADDETWDLLMAVPRGVFRGIIGNGVFNQDFRVPR